MRVSRLTYRAPDGETRDGAGHLRDRPCGPRHPFRQCPGCPKLFRRRQGSGKHQPGAARSSGAPHGYPGEGRRDRHRIPWMRDLPPHKGRNRSYKAGAEDLLREAGRPQFPMHRRCKPSGPPCQQREDLETGCRRTIEAEGKLDLSGKEPAFTLTTKITALEHFSETQVETDISGDLHIAGTTQDFEGTFSFGNKGESWKDLTLKGKVRGDTEVIEPTSRRRCSAAPSRAMRACPGRPPRDCPQYHRPQPRARQTGLEGKPEYRHKGELLFPEEHPMEGPHGLPGKEHFPGKGGVGARGRFISR